MEVGPHPQRRRIGDFPSRYSSVASAPKTVGFRRLAPAPNPPVGNLPKIRLYGRDETSFRFLKFAFTLLSAAHCQIPRLLGRDIDRKADQTAWIALGISQERKTEVNGRCNMRSHVPSQKPVLRLSSRTEFS